MTLGETKSFVCSNISLQLYSVTKEELLALKIVSKKWVTMGIASIQDLQSYYAKVNEADEKENHAITRKLMKQMKKKTFIVL